MRPRDSSSLRSTTRDGGSNASPLSARSAVRDADRDVDRPSPAPPTARSGPIDVAELLRQRREQKEQKQSDKPVFVPRALRERQAAEREAKEAEERRLRDQEFRQQMRQAEAAKAHEELQKRKQAAAAAAPPPPAPSSHARHGRGGRGRDTRRAPSPPPAKSRQRTFTEEDIRALAAERDLDVNTLLRAPPEALEALVNERVQARESQLIRERYVGGSDPKRRTRRTGERRPTFDWDLKDNTSDEVQPRVVGQFWRGQVGGMVEIKQEFSRHWTTKALSEMTPRDWSVFREDFDIAVKGGGQIPHPIRSWEESTIPKQILAAVRDIGYKDPSPIQRQSIPVGLQNRDLIGIAQTGSGKTAAFMIPMLSFIMRLPPLTERNRADGPYALILAPTRELAQQLESEALKFSSRLGFSCVSVVGGHSIAEQSRQLADGAHIVIATPGRMLDCLESHVVVLNQCTYVVVDEADVMIEMNFQKELTSILEAMPVCNKRPESLDNELGIGPLDRAAAGEFLDVKSLYRQTVMFTATMKPPVEMIARQYMHRPVTVTIGVAGQSVDTVEQRVIMCTESAKFSHMESVLNQFFEPPIIIFVNHRRTADNVSNWLETRGYSVTVIHGDKRQDQREASINALKDRSKDILVATDVAGRGLDVKDVSLVINFDMSKSIEPYTHRIGRTGRAGKSGLAITFLTADDEPVYYDLFTMLKSNPLSRVPRELEFHDAVRSRTGGFLG